MAESNREEIAKLEALYANNPGGRVFTHLAEAYRKAGELDRAREILEDGITRHPEYASAHVVLGRVLQDQGANQAASAAFRRVLDLDPENRVALRSLGDLARDGHAHEDALTYFRQLLSLDPTDDQLVRIIDQLNTALHTAVEPDAVTASVADPESQPTHFEQEPAGLQAESPFEEPVQVEPTPQVPDTSTEEAFFEAFSSQANAAPQDGPHDLETFVAGDIHLDWDTAGVPVSDEPVLPGDLAEFAATIRDDDGTDAPAADDGTQPGSTYESAAAESELAPAESELAPAESELAPDESEFAAAESEFAAAESEFAADESEFAGDPVTQFGEPVAELESHAAIDDAALDEADIRELETSADILDDLIMEVGEFVDIGENEVVAPADEDAAEVVDVAPETAEGAQERTFEELLSSARPASWQKAVDPSELQTETLAELYLSQGFDHRAAEVYRSLLDRNPADERLRRRLDEVEARLRESAQAVSPAEASWTAREDAHADGLDTVWTENREPADLSPTLYAWTPEADEPAGPSIGQYFAQLLSWRPPAPEDEHGGTAVAIQPDVEEGNAEAEFAEPTESAELAESVEPAGSVEPAETVEPAEITPPSLLSQFSAPLNAVEAAFEEWFSGVPGAEPGAGGEPVDLIGLSEPVAAQPDPAEGALPSEAPVLPAETSPAPVSPPEESEDDEDLEMFRSWLQSLKR